MTNLQRLKLELNNKEYFTDTEYTVFLEENNLSPEDTYIKEGNQRSLLYTIVDILESLLNDVDLYRRVQTEFQTTGQAVQYFRNRIQDLKIKIQDLSDDADVSPFTLMFTRRG
ncbi:conserved hypothetical protein [Alkaliphilus metalliredigens QYMF]|uniref:Uncharacterized protein n=1 Tax=Alkaliphilus metalliredigens (strain QYMF) TaxID=293826 RepID=A6TS14_ALKMQ|nr:hypothetical protein [Alkaliphilus metalliredigens]ABR48982.1 conserved hypothetical protein [Alkaliphilus metalliredigens QYMF]